MTARNTLAQFFSALSTMAPKESTIRRLKLPVFLIAMAVPLSITGQIPAN
jgi:hypothetical protein